MAVRLSALRAGPGAILRLELLGKLKKSNDLIGNRTRDLPACSIVPQPTKLPRDLEAYLLTNITLILKFM
jgi:hypothetical protein